MEIDLACLWCSRAIEWKRKGFKPSFCDANCRMAAHRAKLAKRRRKFDAEYKEWADIATQLDKAQRALSTVWPLTSGQQRENLRSLWIQTQRLENDWKQKRPIPRE